MGKFVDLTGQKFGRLTVIERAADKKYSQAHWICKCECGNITKPISSRNLRTGNTKSCGCYNKEKAHEHIQKVNEQQWQDEVFRQKHSERSREQMKQQWQDDNFRQMKSERTTQQWQDDNFRQMKSERSREQMKQQWQDDNFRQMQTTIHKGNKCNFWKGGITPISQHLRHLNVQWLEDCKQKANYTCQLTGQVGGNLNTHHLKAFSTIVIEAHNLHNIQIKEQVKDYTQEELRLLEEYVGSWHKDNSNAVVLSEDVHNLFHKLYAYGDNTPEQFEEFRERYMAGEFKEILK